MFIEKKIAVLISVLMTCIFVFPLGAIKIGLVNNSNTPLRIRNNDTDYLNKCTYFYGLSHLFLDKGKHNHVIAYLRYFPPCAYSDKKAIWFVEVGSSAGVMIYNDPVAGPRNGELLFNMNQFISLRAKMVPCDKFNFSSDTQICALFYSINGYS